MAQVVLGRNAAEVTAVTANSPGALELLPTTDYNGGKPWLFVREPRNADGSKPPAILALPRSGDPYSEIYQSSAWYGLVPTHNEWMLSLGPTNEPSGQDDIPPSETDRYGFAENIRTAKEFHAAVGGRYKLPTYIHYGAQGERDRDLDKGGLLGSGFMAADNRCAWGTVSWIGQGVGALNPATMQIVLDDGNGRIRTNDGIWLHIADPESPGDGTVPIESAAAPAGQPTIVMTFSHGHGHSGKRNRTFGYDHQDSYKDERALYASLYAIIKIAQSAHWYPTFEQESA